MPKNKKIKTNPNRSSLNRHATTHPLSEKVLSIPYFFSEAGLKPSFFTSQDLSNLSLSSQIFYSMTRYERNQRAAQKLLTYVISGEQTKACAMIQVNPDLLLIKSRAVDYSGRTIIATPFQAAIGAGDKPMWEMMLPYFEGFPGEALRQFHEWFPKGITDTPASELEPTYNAIVFAIIHDKDHGQSAIEAFRNNISAQKEIRQGTLFNLQHLIAAHHAYMGILGPLGTWANCNLFWKQVIGYVQRQMTTYDAQIHCSGMQSVLVNKYLFSRKLEFSYGEKFFPLQDGAGLGFDFGCYSYYGGATTFGVPLGPHVNPIPALTKYVEQKQKHLQDLESHLSKECVISPSNCS